MNWARRAAEALERLDPRSVNRLKGLRLVAGYGLAALLSALLMPRLHPGSGQLGSPGVTLLAANIALWAGVSEMQDRDRPRAVRDLIVFCAAAALGAAFQGCASSMLRAHSGSFRADLLALVVGAFLVGALRCFGTLGAGVGSQWYIGQILAQGTPLPPGHDLLLTTAALLAMVATISCRLLPGIGATRLPAHGRAADIDPPSTPPVAPRSALTMGLQSALAALAVVAIDAIFHLRQPVWAITTCAYVIAATLNTTITRGRQRIAGTAFGVALGLAAVPVAAHHPAMAWIAAAPGMVIYTVAAARRYDIACGAFAFILVLTLAATGQHSLPLLAARAWETLLGAIVALTVARLLPLRETAQDLVKQSA